MNQKTLIKLLDFSSAKNRDDVLNRAHAIATELLFNWQIKSYRGSLHPIWAIEFYLSIPGIFEDDAEHGGASHKRIEQLSSGKFYVHTKSKGTKWTYPIFNRHGIDITCGNIDHGIFGGILLRHLGGKNHEDGSGRALRVILRGDKGHEKIPHESTLFGWNKKELKVLEKLNNADIFNNSTGISLEYLPRNDSEKMQVSSSKRIGIDKTKFATEPLRFFLEPVV